MKPIVALTIGDFNGIGPEIVLKAAAHPAVKRLCTPVLVGPLSIFEHVRKSFKLRLTLAKAVFPVPRSSRVLVVDVGDGIWPDIKYGTVARAAGRTAGVAIVRAVELCVAREVDAMVTAPVSKEALSLAGYDFPGQTEMVTLLSRSQHVAMMLVSEKLRVGLVTIHVPLSRISEQLKKEKVFDKLGILHEALKADFGITAPRVAVLALNPHAGENGRIGGEEQEILAPAITDARQAGIRADGPFAADAFFGRRLYEQYDAVLAMYHDQGLIPLKLLSFGKAVNYSAGLKIVRTSPDHGTAFDIAGKNKASISSIVEAIKLAVAIAKARNKNRTPGPEAP